TLSARTETALEVIAADLARHLREHPELPISDVGYTLQAGREGMRQRRTVVCRSTEEAAAALEAAGSRAVTSGIQQPRARPVAFMFPGQGTQHPGMGRGLYDSEPTFRKTLDRCAEILRPRLGLDLRTLIYPAGGGEERAADL